MGASARWTLIVGVVLLGAAWSSPLPRPLPADDPRLSSLELAIIKSIVETVPYVTKGGGRSYDDWSVVESSSKQLEGAEIEVVQVGQREPDLSGRAGDGGYPDDWNVVRSVSRQLAAREGGDVDSQAAGSEGSSDDWGIVRSIAAELHLDVEVVPNGGDGVDADSQSPVEQPGRGNFQGTDVMFPGKDTFLSNADTTGGSGNMPIDIRSQPIDIPAGNVMDVQREYHGGGSIDAGTSDNGEISGEQNNAGGGIEWSIVRSISSEQEPIGEEMPSTGNQHSTSSSETQEVKGDADRFGNGEISGEQKQAGGAIGWSIVRSISSEQEPIGEEVASTGEHPSTSSSETQEVKGDADSYLVVQPVSTELQPADIEAGEIPASLTEMLPPAVDQTGDSWNIPPSNGLHPSEVQSSETDQSSRLVTPEPCETGHKRVKNVCRKVYTFQLKSHLG